jgi:orotate phosphoribosyltransferase
MDRNQLARRIFAASHLTGEFRLRSGATSREYFDKYRFESDPALLRAIAEAMAELVPPGVELLAGLEMGGIPLATMLSQVTGLPALFVRKKAKEYGTAKLAEGPDFAGRRVAVIEDVVTSGGQLVISSADLRAAGASIACALCVIDREAGGPEALAAQGIELLALYRMSELKRVTAGA